MPHDLELLRGAIWICISFASLLFVLQFIVFPTMVEEYRQRIFKLRRDMFLLMVQEKISAEHPAYTYLRRSMNGQIRFAERLTFMRLLMAWVTSGKAAKQQQEKIEQDLKTIPNQDAQKRLAFFRTQLGLNILRHVIAVSPSAWILALLLVSVAIVVCLIALIIRQLGRLCSSVKAMATTASDAVEMQASELIPDNGTRQQLAMADTKSFNIM